jgi:hypothetical protein
MTNEERDEIEKQVRAEVRSYVKKVGGWLGVANLIGILGLLASVVTAKYTATGVAEATTKAELGAERTSRLQEELIDSEKRSRELQVELRVVQKQLDAHKPYRDAFEKVAGKLSEQERGEFLELIESFSEDKASFDPVAKLQEVSRKVDDLAGKLADGTVLAYLSGEQFKPLGNGFYSLTATGLRLTTHELTAKGIAAGDGKKKDGAMTLNGNRVVTK